MTLKPGSSAPTRLRVSSCTSLNRANEESDTSTLLIRSSLRSMSSVFQHIERLKESTSSCERIAPASKVRLMSGPSFRTVRHIFPSSVSVDAFSSEIPAAGGTVSCRCVRDVLSQEEKNVYRGTKWPGNLSFGGTTLAGSRKPWKARALKQYARRSIISSDSSHNVLRPSTHADTRCTRA